ncbi:MAG: FAD-dependent oxidoreductase [Myxococcota bacterium]
MTGGYFSARDLRRELVLDCDVVVVGSGAGGAVVATELAKAGRRVVVLEEGPRVDAAQHGAMRPSESLRHVWRDGALSLAVGMGDTPAVNVTMGRVVGGSSMLTGGVCFRIPDKVMAEWSERGLSAYSQREMEPYFEHVEKAIHVEEVPAEMRSHSTNLFIRGAQRRGIEMKPMRRNTKGCGGCGRCNFGCPEEAKLSVDLSYLPRAVAEGAEVWSHCLVERIETKGRRAVGVSGHILNGRGGKAKSRLRVHARQVILAAGAWHSPQILKRSGIGRRSPVGDDMTLHPGFRVLARFEEKVEGWKGALQSAWTDHYEDERISLMALFVPAGVLGATMPGVGVEHTDNAKHIPHLAMFGGVIHDQGGGTVRRGVGREPVVTYRMSKEDRALVPRVIRHLAETFFEAGAKEVYLPVLGLRSVPIRQLPIGCWDAHSMRRAGTCSRSSWRSASGV